MDGRTNRQMDRQTNGQMGWMGRWMHVWMDDQDSPKRNNICRYIFEVEKREAHSETPASNLILSSLQTES